MLHGHLDEVSHQSINGWAADDAKPDEVVDVSIFIDGRKIAQVACDRLRPDLQVTGQYGEGRHGFVHNFETPLAGPKDTRLSVRYSATGQSLGRGDRLLNDETIKVLKSTSPVADDEPACLPGPRTPRALFELLYWHDREFGLGPLLSRLDLDGFTPHEIYYAAFGKLPGAGLMSCANGRYYPHDHLNELLLSDAFQENLIPLLLNAYEEKRRLIFLHIPKCAGTDLSNKLKKRYPSINFNIMDKSWTTEDAMLRRLSRLAVQFRFADTIYLCGHAEPNYYMNHELVRPIDRVVTVIRHPFEVMVSQVNYVLTRFQADAERGVVEPDTELWLQVIGMDSLPQQLSNEFIQDAAMRVLRNPNTVKPNSLCYWLGGNDANAQTALDSLIAQDVEVTDTDHYSDWLAQRWNIKSQTRDNSSVQFFRVDELPQKDLDYMHSIAEEDTKLYQTIRKSIADAGAPSVGGQDLMSVHADG